MNFKNKKEYSIDFYLDVYILCKNIGQEILFSGANQAGILSSNIIDNWLKTTSQFRHLCVQRSTIFCDAKYNILRRLSSFVNDGLFFVICLN